MTGNNAPGLTSVTGILLVWATLMFVVRIWVKTRLRTVDFWGHDDTSVSLSFVLAIAQVATVFHAVSKGYGGPWSDLSDQAEASVQKSLYASQILYVCCMGCTRLSTCFFTARLSRPRRHRNLGHVWTAGCSIVVLASVMAVAIRGNASEPWTSLDGTKTMYYRWLGVEVAGLVLDVGVFATASTLIWALHMPVMKRLMVSFVFLTRLLITPFVVLRLLELQPGRNTNQDKPNLMIGVFTEACMHIGLMLTTVTSLKPFLRPFHEGHVITAADSKLSGYKSGPRGHKSSQYLMLSTAKDTSVSKPAVTVSLASPRGAADGPPAQLPKAFVPDSHGAHRSMVDVPQEPQFDNSDSERMFISKTQTWTVEYEDRSRGRGASGSVERAAPPPPPPP